MHATAVVWGAQAAGLWRSAACRTHVAVNGSIATTFAATSGKLQASGLCFPDIHSVAEMFVVGRIRGDELGVWNLVL